MFRMPVNLSPVNFLALGTLIYNAVINRISDIQCSNTVLLMVPLCALSVNSNILGCIFFFTLRFFS